MNTQINRLTMPELPALADVLGEIGAHAWLVQLTAAMGQAADRANLLLQPYHLLDLFPLLYWLKQNKLVPRGIELFMGNNLGYFGPYAESLRYGSERGHSWAGCGAGRWSLGIEADGSVKGCPSLPSLPYAVGKVQEFSIEEIHRMGQLTSNIPQGMEHLWGFCRTCPNAERCRGGCTWTTHVLMGRPGNNPYCHYRALELQKRGLRERIQRVKQAPGLPFDHGQFELVTEPIESLDDELESPVPMSYLARLFDLVPQAKSLWPEDSVARALQRH
ncbi:MAG: SPASM domain-containing protein [Isosphaeraceae bacterium]